MDPYYEYLHHRANIISFRVPCQGRWWWLLIVAGDAEETRMDRLLTYMWIDGSWLASWMHENWGNYPFPMWWFIPMTMLVTTTTSDRWFRASAGHVRRANTRDKCMITTRVEQEGLFVLEFVFDYRIMTVNPTPTTIIVILWLARCYYYDAFKWRAPISRFISFSSPVAWCVCTCVWLGCACLLSRPAQRNVEC